MCPQETVPVVRDVNVSIGRATSAKTSSPWSISDHKKAVVSVCVCV